MDRRPPPSTPRLAPARGAARHLQPRRRRRGSVPGIPSNGMLPTHGTPMLLAWAIHPAPDGPEETMGPFPAAAPLRPTHPLSPELWYAMGRGRRARKGPLPARERRRAPLVPRLRPARKALQRARHAVQGPRDGGALPGVDPRPGGRGARRGARHRAADAEASRAHRVERWLERWLEIMRDRTRHGRALAELPARARALGEAERATSPGGAGRASTKSAPVRWRTGRTGSRSAASRRRRGATCWVASARSWAGSGGAS